MKNKLLLNLVVTSMVVYLIVTYQKQFAYWGNVNVLILSLITAPLLSLGIKFALDTWLLDSFWGDYEVPRRFFVVLTLGTILSPLLGINFQEPNWSSDEVETTTVQQSKGQYYNSNRQRESVSIGDWLPTAGTDADGEALVFLLLIVLVLILLVGSAIIPHFWVFAIILLSSMMWWYYLHDRKYQST